MMLPAQLLASRSPLFLYSVNCNTMCKDRQKQLTSDTDYRRREIRNC